MRFDILTLFPQMFAPFLENGVTRRAFASGQVEVHLWNPRDFAEGNYRRVDDRPFGGGPGMVMLADPLQRCLDAAQQSRAQALPEEAVVPVVLFSPIGHTLHHGAVAQWAQGSGAILLCGRYEGIDQRFIDANVTHQISLGDFVLSGGELPAMVLMDAVIRQLPGAIKDLSASDESFSTGLLDAPHYTRPEVWRDMPVPEVLLSGHHKNIRAWTRKQALQITAQTRPDLVKIARSKNLLTREDERVLRDIKESTES